MRNRAALTVALCVALTSLAGAAAPDAPQNLTAVVNGNTVTLDWTAPSTGDAPTGYFVLASLSPGGPFIAALPVSATTLVVPNVPDGVYYVHVRAVNIEGASTASNEVIVVVPGGGGGCATPPDAPATLTGTAAGSVVTLTWAAAQGCPATGYVVQAGSGPGLSDIALINVTGATSLSASAPPGTYYVRVVGLNAAGGSAPSPEIVITVGGASPARVTIGFDGLASAVNQSPIATYSESGFTLNTTAQQWMTLTTYGNPAPFIQFLRTGGQPEEVGEVAITAGGSLFSFESVDLYSSITPIPHEIIGVRAGVPVFTITGTVPNTFGAFGTVVSSQPAALIDTLVIRLTNPAACCSNPVGLDNIVLTR